MPLESSWEHWLPLIPHFYVHHELAWPLWALEHLRCYVAGGVGSVLPESGSVQGVSISTQGSSLISSKVFSILPFDGHTAALSKLQEEIFRHLTIAAHSAIAGHIPELATKA